MKKTLCAAALAALALPALAAPYASTYNGVIAHSTFPAILTGESYSVTLVFDNGGNTADNQVWNPSHLRCALWRMNDDGNVVMAQNLLAHPPSVANGTFTTGTDSVSQVFSAVIGYNQGPGSYSLTGMSIPPGGLLNWVADGSNPVLYRDGFSPAFDDATFGVPMIAAHWTPPQPFSGPCLADGGALGAPTHLTATPGNGQVTITWQAPTGGTQAASYTVTALPGLASCTAQAPATSCTVQGLTNGTAYTFTAASVAPGTISDASAPVTATPLAAGPGPGSSQPVPTLSQWGLALLTALLALAGLRRRLAA